MKGKFWQATTSISVANLLSSGLWPQDSGTTGNTSTCFNIPCSRRQWNTHPAYWADHSHLTAMDCGSCQHRTSVEASWSNVCSSRARKLNCGHGHASSALMYITFRMAEGSEGILEKGRTKTNAQTNHERYQTSFQPFQAVRWYLMIWKSFSFSLLLKWFTYCCVHEMLEISQETSRCSKELTILW